MVLGLPIFVVNLLNVIISI